MTFINCLHIRMVNFYRLIWKLALRSSVFRVGREESDFQPQTVSHTHTETRAERSVTNNNLCPAKQPDSQLFTAFTQL